MTDEEIRKLARYAAENLYKGYKEKNISLMEDEFRMLISIILKDHCIVEKEKVNSLQYEIFKEVMDAHDADDWQGVAHYILDVMPRSFNELFNDTEK